MKRTIVIIINLFTDYTNINKKYNCIMGRYTTIRGSSSASQ